VLYIEIEITKMDSEVGCNLICRCSHLILLGDDMQLRVSIGAELRGFWLSECLSLAYLCFLIYI
jgi:hypothetical protein